MSKIFSAFLALALILIAVGSVSAGPFGLLGHRCHCGPRCSARCAPKGCGCQTPPAPVPAGVPANAHVVATWGPPSQPSQPTCPNCPGFMPLAK